MSDLFSLGEPEPEEKPRRAPKRELTVPQPLHDDGWSWDDTRRALGWIK